ncbi:HAMP domain-containing sensor histidine kinase [Oceanirhabdus sp. W0125-5]|uniref:HAMP domain-containing sensor histidine kinase n=1 Tax=Oceanirhabdus sp. W0125-5 TaxID=2999116 RepID=UPI0022F2B4E1|nr:HAMP domain-containing sensor histidine kinase [Oceanirhabdus sp. W0125-5]WBW96988.1 HAMP domain-containing sensor histidine kinase [Oceanirhabdus sp. W0125-5]
MIRKKDSIRGKIYFNNALLILVIVLILELIFIMAVRQYYMQSVRSLIKNRSYAAIEFYNVKYSYADIKLKSKIILETESEDKDFFLEIFDKDGRMITNSNGENQLEISKDKDIWEIIGGKSEYAITERNKGKQREISITFPLKKLGNIEGAMRYRININEIISAIINISIILILAGLFVIIIAFIFSSILARDILNPVRDLTLAAETISKGDFTVKVNKKSKDEIGKLCDTINMMTEEIEKSNRAKNDFISSISHELRTPLAAIRGWSELLKEDLDESDKAMGLDIITNESIRLNTLVEQLLDFSKLQSKRVILKRDIIDLNSLITNVTSYFKKRFEEDQISLNITLANNKIEIKGDENRIKQVMINVIDNAMKFTPSEGKISVSSVVEEEYAIIKISDTGVGISEEDLKRVTEKFFKGSSSKSGTGIGLALCKEIMELHKGEFLIDSKLGVGTEVVLKFPR